MERESARTALAAGGPLSEIRRWRFRHLRACSSLLCALGPIFSARCAGAGEGEARYKNVDLRDSPLSTRPGRRETVAVEPESLFKLGGHREDTLLYDPGLMVGDDDGIYVYDYGRFQVLRLSSSGELDWAFGRRGRGPDEFRLVRDIDIDRRGRLWVLDVENARTTVLARSGEVVARIRLGDMPRADQVVPLAGGRAVLVTLAGGRPLYVVDRDGGVVDRLSIPWREFGRLHPLASQMLAASERDGDRFVVAFRSGNGFFTYDATDPLPYHGVYVEHADFPAVHHYKNGSTTTTKVDRGTDTAVSLAIGGGRLYVHFGGASEARRALIDIYDLATGEYEVSWALPRPVEATALGGGIVYGIHADPYPAIEAWRAPAH